MVRYLSLVSFTDLGVTKVSESMQRAADFESRVAAAGGKVLHQFWALGDIDGCILFEAPDEVTGAALLLELNRQDNVRTKTVRIFDAAEFGKIVAAAT